MLGTTNAKVVLGSSGRSTKFLKTSVPKYFGTGIGKTDNSSNFYISLGSFTPSNNSFYIQTKVNLNQGDYILSTKNTNYMAIYISGSKWSLDVGDGSSWVIDYGNNRKSFLEKKEDIYIRLQYDGTKYAVLVSKDGNSWETMVDGITSSQIVSTCEILLGNKKGALNGAEGLYNIKETKIVNDYLTTPVVVFDGTTAVEGVDYTINGNYVNLENNDILGSINVYQERKINGFTYLETFNPSNYMSFDNFKIKLKLEFLTSAPSSWLYFLGSDDNFALEVSPSDNANPNKIMLYVGSKLIESANQIETGVVYDVELQYNSTDGYTLLIYKDDVLSETLTSSTTTKDNLPSVIGNNNAKTYLEHYKVYINDEIIWSLQ